MSFLQAPTMRAGPSRIIARTSIHPIRPAQTLSRRLVGQSGSRTLGQFRKLSTAPNRPALRYTRANHPAGRRWQSTIEGNASESARDDSHPYLWHHTFPNQRTIGLSLLSQRPLYGSRTILGYLPLEGAMGLEDFQENPSFLATIEELIKEGLAEGCSVALTSEAAARPTDGYMNINDWRRLPPTGRIAEPEDTLGTVFVHENKIDASTYAPLPSYRLITSDGPMVLPEGLDDFVRKRLENILEEELRDAGKAV